MGGGGGAAYVSVTLRTLWQRNDLPSLSSISGGKFHRTITQKPNNLAKLKFCDLLFLSVSHLLRELQRCSLTRGVAAGHFQACGQNFFLFSQKICEMHRGHTFR